MAAFTPVTDADLARARDDPAFKQRMLEQNLEILLSGLQKLRRTTSSSKSHVEQIREGVEAAVKLAELIQSPAPARPRGR